MANVLIDRFRALAIASRPHIRSLLETDCPSDDRLEGNIVCFLAGYVAGLFLQNRDAELEAAADTLFSAMTNEYAQTLTRQTCGVEPLNFVLSRLNVYMPLGSGSRMGLGQYFRALCITDRAVFSIEDCVPVSDMERFPSALTAAGREALERSRTNPNLIRLEPVHGNQNLDNALIRLVGESKRGL